MHEQIACVMKNFIFGDPGRAENKAWVYLIHTREFIGWLELWSIRRATTSRLRLPVNSVFRIECLTQSLYHKIEVWNLAKPHEWIYWRLGSFYSLVSLAYLKNQSEELWWKRYLFWIDRMYFRPSWIPVLYKWGCALYLLYCNKLLCTTCLVGSRGPWNPTSRSVYFDFLSSVFPQSTPPGLLSGLILFLQDVITQLSMRCVSDSKLVSLLSKTYS